MLKGVYFKMAKKPLTVEEYKAKVETKKAKREKFFNAFAKVVAFCLAIALVYSSTFWAYKKINSAGTAGGQVTNEPATEAPTAPAGAWDKSEGVENWYGQMKLFVTAFTGVKNNAKEVTFIKEIGSNYNGIVEAGALSSIGKSLMDSLLKETEKNEVWTDSAAIMAGFPPENTTCNFDVDNPDHQAQIQEIIFKEEGDYYIITVKFNPETNPTQGYGVGSISGVITYESIKEPIKDIPVVNSLEPTCNYENVLGTAKIEKSTGNMVEYYMDMPLVLVMSGSGSEYKVGLRFEKWFTMKY